MSSISAAKMTKGPTHDGDHRTRSRRRGATLDAAILRATIAEIDQHGYADLSIERVAERAGASKASVYRRWPPSVRAGRSTP